ncbi:MAG: hypothetical protein DRH37_03595 [Deltaproteobacteria bacterium]|nr:MAG: hypothetical protein DRH37_03595 [Deltaproteobacteria bacterium]
MGFLDGIIYNLRGLWFGIRTPKLLFWGLVRFAMVIVITIISATFILSYHQEILDLIWNKPESVWIVWLWRVLSWLLSLVLVGISAVISYLLSQILFSIVIMDYMSRITEKIMAGAVREPEKMKLLPLFFYLIKQEIPRAIIPVFVSLVLILGGLTPLGPVLTIFSCMIAAIFLAWDNTDLLPARQLVRFRNRFRFLLKNLPFHLGFGLFFLIPGLNILFLSFAPVGATLYHLEKKGVPPLEPDGSNQSNPVG